MDEVLRDKRILKMFISQRKDHKRGEEKIKAIWEDNWTVCPLEPWRACLGEEVGNWLPQVRDPPIWVRYIHCVPQAAWIEFCRNIYHATLSFFCLTKFLEVRNFFFFIPLSPKSNPVPACSKCLIKMHEKKDGWMDWEKVGGFERERMC